jgi:hypothetical protein
VHERPRGSVRSLDVQLGHSSEGTDGGSAS